MGVSLRGARFVDLYLLHFNAGKAYLEAGFNAKPAPSADACASRLLSSAKVRALLAVRAKAMFDRMVEGQDRLMQAYSFTAFGDPRELAAELADV